MVCIVVLFIIIYYFNNRPPVPVIDTVKKGQLGHLFY